MKKLLGCAITLCLFIYIDSIQKRIWGGKAVEFHPRNQAMVKRCSWEMSDPMLNVPTALPFLVPFPCQLCATQPPWVGGQGNPHSVEWIPIMVSKVQFPSSLMGSMWPAPTTDDGDFSNIPAFPVPLPWFTEPLTEYSGHLCYLQAMKAHQRQRPNSRHQEKFHWYFLGSPWLRGLSSDR